MKKWGLVITILSVLLMATGCSQVSKKSVSAPKSDHSLNIFSQALQSKVPTVWFPISFGGSAKLQSEGLSTETEVPSIFVIQNGRVTRYVASTDNWGLLPDSANEKLQQQDKSLTLGELSKMSTADIIRKYQSLDKATYKFYQNHLLKQILSHAEKYVASGKAYDGEDLTQEELSANDKYAGRVFKWLKESGSGSYQAPKSQKIQAYVAPDNTGNNTKQEKILFCNVVNWGKHSHFVDDEQLAKQLGIPTVTAEDGGDVETRMSIQLPTHTVRRSLGSELNLTPSSSQVSQVIYKNHYYGYWESENYAVITPKETFARLGTMNTKFKLDKPTSKGVDKLNLY